MLIRPYPIGYVKAEGYVKADLSAFTDYPLLRITTVTPLPHTQDALPKPDSRSRRPDKFPKM